MGTERLQAFTDGVIAIVITIMVLEIKAPSDATLAALLASLPILLTYVFSFVNVGIFWNNHHHMLHAAERVDGKALWANLFLLFWISLVPFVIRWIDETGFQALPTAAYGAVLAMSAFGYLLLEWALVSCNGPNSALALAVGRDRKAIISMALYGVAILLAFWSPWAAIVVYVALSLAWFLPDRRIETLKRE
ncbi:MAG TPA: TMEM175 family protein [Roseiarcus sp.]|nr:TMEM175 family protein [Roseiarcus sp.]